MNNDYSQDLADKVSVAVDSPETIAPETLKKWMEDQEFLDAYRLAMETKTALLANESADESAELFARFRRQHPDFTEVSVPTGLSRLQGHARRILAGLVAAAACVAAVFLLKKPSAEEAMPVPADNKYLYQAVASPDTAVTITQGGKTMSLASMARQKQARTENITVIGSTATVQPIDYSEYEIIPSTINVPQGKVVMLTLPDGSKVWLNACSSLIYPTSFKPGAPRRVQLKGEAYFAVTRDPSHPFIVDCNGTQTRVLGTEFNIRSLDTNGASCITLVTGSVQVTKGGLQMKIHPNQAVTVGADGAMSVADDVDIESVTCWRNSQFYFDGKPLRDIMIEVGRWYNMDVIIGQNSHINDRLHFRGERQWTINELIEQMNMICNTQIKIEDNSLVIY